MAEISLHRRTFTSLSQQQQSPVSNLRDSTRYITSHNSEGKAVIHSTLDYGWRAVDDNQSALSIVYSTPGIPVRLTDDEDIKAYDTLLDQGMGLVYPGRTMLRCVDTAPGYACPMHRTKSMDFGIVLEGEIEMVFDSGDVTTLKKGDVVVQRAMQHEWYNKSKSEWVRMMFILRECAPFEVAVRPVREERGIDAVTMCNSSNHAYA